MKAANADLKPFYKRAFGKFPIHKCSYSIFHLVL